MSIPGVDYAGDHPTPSGLAAAGKKFACRYGGPGGDWKALTLTEARALIAAGISIVANAEGLNDGLLGGWNVGADWARQADAHFRACGMPDGRPIYLSVDFPCTATQWPSVANALKGAASVIGASRIGVYGSYNVMRWARRDGVALWFWQTYAWSGGLWATGNNIEQTLNKVPLADGIVDLDRALTSDYGQWGVGTTMAVDMQNLYNMMDAYTHGLGTWKTTGGSNITIRPPVTDSDLLPINAKLDILVARPSEVDAQPVIDALAENTAAVRELIELMNTNGVPTVDVIREAVGDEIRERMQD